MMLECKLIYMNIFWLTDNGKRQLTNYLTNANNNFTEKQKNDSIRGSMLNKKLKLGLKCSL